MPSQLFMIRWYQLFEDLGLWKYPGLFYGHDNNAITIMLHSFYIFSTQCYLRGMNCVWFIDGIILNLLPQCHPRASVNFPSCTFCLSKCPPLYTTAALLTVRTFWLGYLQTWLPGWCLTLIQVWYSCQQASGWSKMCCWKLLDWSLMIGWRKPPWKCVLVHVSTVMSVPHLLTQESKFLDWVILGTWERNTFFNSSEICTLFIGILRFFPCARFHNKLTF